MSDLAARRASQQDRESTVACFCDTCDRVLYVTRTDLHFCPVCSSTVTPVVESEIDLRSEPAAKA